VEGKIGAGETGTTTNGTRIWWGFDLHRTGGRTSPRETLKVARPKKYAALGGDAKNGEGGKGLLGQKAPTRKISPMQVK